MTTYISSISNKWSEIPYPNQERVYHGIEKTAGDCALNYIRKNKDNTFETLDGKSIAFEITDPCNYNFEEELKLVQKVQENITYEQIQIAKHWGTGVPIMQIIPIVLTLIDTYKITPPRSARILSSVSKVINDAFVITWHLKYLWDYPRPVQLNQCLKTVLSTPIFPTYPSGHSVVSSAAMTVLSYYFPKEAQKLEELAKTASISRLYGGIHFKCDLDQGLMLGKQIGEIAVGYIKEEKDINNLKTEIQTNEFLDAPIMPNYTK